MSNHYEEKFKKASITLLNKSILYEGVKEDRIIYRFIKEHFQDFQNHFSRMGFILERYDTYQTLCLKAEEDVPVSYESTSNLEIIMFIILREHYIHHNQLEENVYITREEILDSLPEHISKTKYKEILSKFRRHDLISWNITNDFFDPNCKITIYPSIAFAQNDTIVHQFFEQLKEQIQKETSNGDCAEETLSA